MSFVNNIFVFYRIRMEKIEIVQNIIFTYTLIDLIIN